jgi:CO/xanthine dehydrogenase FAD-binding subunit
MRAVCLRDTEGILKSGITAQSAADFGTYVKANVTTGSNMRGSAEYRKILSGVLAKRALLGIAELSGEDGKTCR